MELQLAEGVSGLVSMVSARGKPDPTGYAAPIVPDELPIDQTAFDAMLKDLRKNEIVSGKFPVRGWNAGADRHVARSRHGAG